MRPYRGASWFSANEGHPQIMQPYYSSHYQPQQMQTQQYLPQQPNHHRRQQQQQGMSNLVNHGGTASSQTRDGYYTQNPGGFSQNQRVHHHHHYHHHHHHHHHHPGQNQQQHPTVMYNSMGQSHRPHIQGYGSEYSAHHHQHYHMQYQQHQQHQQQTYYRDGYRGGRGRGGHRGGQVGGQHYHVGGESRESYFTVHLKDFAELKQAGRRGSLRESLSPDLLAKMSHRAAGGCLKILVIIGKKSVAACMSIPRSSDDVILSAEVATEFLDVQHVPCDYGVRLVDLEDGTHVARHIYSNLRAALSQLTFFDKESQTDESAIDLQAPATTLLKDVITSRPVFNALRAALEREDEAADDLWARLLAAPSPTQSDTPDTAPQPRSTAGPPLLSSRGVGLLASVQGTRLFTLATAQPRKREMLFRLLQDVPTAPLQAPEPRVVCSPCDLFMCLFSGILTARFLFECFGLVGESSECCDAEVGILCAGFERLGLCVICCDGGSFTTTALVRALCPNRFRMGQRGGTGTGTGTGTGGGGGGGGKRGRDAEMPISHEEEESAHDSTRAEHGKDVSLTTTRTLDDVQMPEEPSGWDLFHAAARAFVAGIIPPVSDAQEETVARRVKLLTQHVVACRAVQSFIPFFVDAIIRAEVKRHNTPESNLPDQEIQFDEDCQSFLMEITNQTGLLVNHSYGNYVLQTVITEMAKRAVPETSVQSILKKAFDSLNQTIFEVSVQKFASNCMETAITASSALPNGNEIVLQFAQGLLSEGPERMTRVALQQFGNYVVRCLVSRLTSMATRALSVTVDEHQRAVALEQQYFTLLSAQFHQLRKTFYGSGLLTWVQTQRDRIHTPSPGS